MTEIHKVNDLEFISVLGPFVPDFYFDIKLSVMNQLRQVITGSRGVYSRATGIFQFQNAHPKRMNEAKTIIMNNNKFPNSIEN